MITYSFWFWLREHLRCLSCPSRWGAVNYYILSLCLKFFLTILDCCQLLTKHKDKPQFSIWFKILSLKSYIITLFCEQHSNSIVSRAEVETHFGSRATLTFSFKRTSTMRLIYSLHSLRYPFNMNFEENEFKASLDIYEYVCRGPNLAT